MENIKEKPITKEQELIDFIYKKKAYIFEYYSIYDLLSLIRYAKNDKTKILYLLDNYSKEENMDMIEKSKSIHFISNINSNQFPKEIRIKKVEKYILKSKIMEQMEQINNN